MPRKLNTATLLLAFGKLAVATAGETPAPPTAAPAAAIAAPERVIKIEIGFEPWALDEAPAATPAVVIPPAPEVPAPASAPVMPVAPAPMPVVLPEPIPSPASITSPTIQPAVSQPVMPEPGKPAPITLQALERLALGRTTKPGTSGPIAQASLTLNPTPADLPNGFVDEVGTSGPKPSGPMTPSQIQALDRQYRTVNAVRLRYYHLLALQRLIAVREELAMVTREAVTAIEGMAATGHATKAELLQAKVEAREQAAALQTAKGVYQAVWQRMAATVGQPEMQPETVAGDLAQGCAMPNFDAAWAHVLEANPELQLARGQVALRQAGLRQSLKSGACDKSSDGMIAQAFAKVGSFGSGTDPQAKQAAWAELARWEAEATRVEQSLRQKLADAYARYNRAKDVVEVYHGQNLPDAKEAYELSVIGYRQGQGSWPQVQLAQRNYFRMSTEHVEALAELRRAELVVLGLLMDVPEETAKAR
jgi:hypothetical protein